LVNDLLLLVKSRECWAHFVSYSKPSE
jgi:hypothetical protein